MLSLPHMIVIFVVVLIVFGPQKLPELARGLGKLMAEFRKASGDFRSAFEQEMRDIDRHTREAEWKKSQEAAPANSAALSAAEPAAPPEQAGEGGIASAPETVARSAESEATTAAAASPPEKTSENAAPASAEGGDPSHGVV
jgi:TatA/E family protein of Tat protein translocase